MSNKLNISRLNDSDIRKWLILEAIGKESDKIDKMKQEDGEYEVKFIVGGVELDFNNVAKRIEKSLDNTIKDEAINILNNKFVDVIDSIMDIQERIKDNRKLFKYEWEE